MAKKLFVLIATIFGCKASSGKPTIKNVTVATVDPEAGTMTFHQNDWVEYMKTCSKVERIVLHRRGSKVALAVVAEKRDWLYAITASNGEAVHTVDATVVSHEDWSRADRAVREALKTIADRNGWKTSNPVGNPLLANGIKVVKPTKKPRRSTAA